MMNSRWNKSKWFTPMQLNFATGAGALTDTGAAGGSGSGTGEGTSGAGVGGGGATGGREAAGVAPPAINWETAPQHFREGYSKLKADYEKLQNDLKPWQGIGAKPEEVAQFRGGYQQVYGEMKGIADTLNINEAELAHAIQLHGLVPVLDQLRFEAQQAEAAANGDQAALSERDLQERIDRAAEQRLSPVLQRENERIVKEANVLVGNTITNLATEAFKAAGLDYSGAPPALKDFIETGVTEALKYDDEGMRSLKFDGKTAAVQRAFQTFSAMFDAAYLARQQMETKRAPAAPQRGGRPPVGAPQGKKPTFDEMINDPDSIRTAGGRPAYST